MIRSVLKKLFFAVRTDSETDLSCRSNEESVDIESCLNVLAVDGCPERALPPPESNIGVHQPHRARDFRVALHGSHLLETRNNGVQGVEMPIVVILAISISGNWELQMVGMPFLPFKAGM